MPGGAGRRCELRSPAADLSELDGERLREVLRGHDAMVIGPGEILVITVPAWWKPEDCREFMSVNAYCGPEIRALVAPAAEVRRARVPQDPFGDIGD